MRPLRILHVTPYAGAAWAYGGIPRVVHALTAGLAERGHDVTVCTTDVCDESTRLGAARRSFRPRSPARLPDGVRLRVFPNLSNRLAYRAQLFLPIGLRGYLRRHASDFDVAHLHACRNVPGVLAARYLAAAGVPYVLAPNGTAPNIERRQLAKRIFDLAFGQRTLSGAARVIAVTDAERRQLIHLGVTGGVIRVVPNPVDLDEFLPAPPRGAFRDRVMPPGAPIVLFLAKLTPRKRVDVVVRAFAQILQTRAWLVIAGNDMGSGKTATALVRALGIQHRTIFAGLLRGRRRIEALADADVLVYPSEDEIFGLVPVEALLAGTPVIVADDSGCGEIVRDLPGGQVVPVGDAQALAAAIQRVLAAPGEWRKAAAEGGARVRAAYARPTVCAALESVYFELVRPHRDQPFDDHHASMPERQPRERAILQ